MDKEDINSNEKGYIINKDHNTYCLLADFIWCNEDSRYNVDNSIKINKPKLSDTESARLAMLKMCPDYTEIKGIGYTTSLVYGVIRDE